MAQRRAMLVWRIEVTAVFLILLQLLSEGAVSGERIAMDTAKLTVCNSITKPVSVSYTLNSCYQCLDTVLISTQGKTVIQPKTNNTFLVRTLFKTTIYINETANIYNSSSSPNITFCKKTFLFDEHSEVLLGVHSNGSCIGSLLDSGHNAYLPILYAAAIIICLSVVWICLSLSYKFLKEKGLLKLCHLKSIDRTTDRDLGIPKQGNTRYGSTGDEQKPLVAGGGSLNYSVLAAGTEERKKSPNKDPTTVSKRHRLISLDAFRGFSLVIMIFVNYGGGGYWFFSHSKWNGLTVADLVFPWFVWIMGVSVVISFKGRRKDSILMRLYQIVRRTLILFALGLFINAEGDNFELTTWRIPGVLQRFAISYFVVALIELVTSELSKVKGGRLFTCWEPVADISNNWIQYVCIFLIEIVWLLTTFLLTTDGCPRGYLGPGGIAQGGAYENCTGGAAGIVDRWFFTESHIYQHPTAREMYHLTQPFDPEGLLGSLNSIVICLLGVQAGRIITLFKGRHIAIIVRLLIWGVILGVVSALLCQGQLDTALIPVNKNLWSLSFILAMAGSGFVLFALFYFLIDVIHLWNGSPFKYPGMNSILIYIAHEVFESYFPFHWPQQDDSHLKFLSANLIATGLWMLVAFYCHCVGFYVKI